MELAARADDRLARLAQVRDVVQRVVEPEDVDPVLRRAGDEAADDVGRDRLGADEEAPAQRDPERCRRARVDRADPLPGALDAAPHGGVEHAAARHLEAREPRAVEDLGDPQHLARRHPPGERLLREQADRGVDEPAARREPTAACGVSRAALRMGRGSATGRGFSRVPSAAVLRMDARHAQVAGVRPGRCSAPRGDRP